MISRNFKFSTPAGRHFFFGYYDVSPLSRDGFKLLAQEASFINKMPDESDKLIIGYFDILKNQWHPLTKTSAWNWQMGCRLQWLGPDFNRYIIYNSRDGGQFISVILDILTGEKIKLPLPIYSVSPDGCYSVTLNFARLYHTRSGYGYAGGKDPFYNEMHPDRDGIYLLNIKTKEYKLIITIGQLFKTNHMDLMDGAKHWVNHLMFNRKGDRFIFLHRWSLPDGGMYTRLYTANYSGSDINLLLDSGMASHFCWKDNNTIICWGRPPSAVSSLRNKRFITEHLIKIIRPLYKKFIPSSIKRRVSQDAYLIIKDRVGVIDMIKDARLNEDGHCSVSPDGKWLLTDTYPDKNHLRKLFLYNFEKQQLIQLGSYGSLPEGLTEDWDISGMRCDLHPRWSFDGRYICFDSVHEGYRGMYLMELFSS